MQRSPWGTPDYVKQLAPGVLLVQTPSHGGLRIYKRQWEQIPEEVRATFYDAQWAEEDCETVIALTLLGIGTDADRDQAILIASRYDRYAPALPYLAATA